MQKIDANNYDESTEGRQLMGIPCDLCKTCYRSWARRYHKNPLTTRFEILNERMNFFRVAHIGKPLDPTTPYARIDSLVEERESVELKLLEDTLDWLEESI